jgi:hypothetical protein
MWTRKCSSASRCRSDSRSDSQSDSQSDRLTFVRRARSEVATSPRSCWLYPKDFVRRGESPNLIALVEGTGSFSIIEVQGEGEGRGRKP